MIDRPDRRAGGRHLIYRLRSLRLGGAPSSLSHLHDFMRRRRLQRSQDGRDGRFTRLPALVLVKLVTGLVAVQMSASSSGSSKNPASRAAAGGPTWGSGAGARGSAGTSSSFGGFARAFPPLFLGRRYAGARCSRGSWGPWVASRRGFSAGARAAAAGGGDLVARAPSLICCGFAARGHETRCGC